jgi:hypothetical protein
MLEIDAFIGSSGKRVPETGTRILAACRFIPSYHDSFFRKSILKIFPHSVHMPEIKTIFPLKGMCHG